MYETGKITNVWLDDLGSELVQPANLNDVYLIVDNSFDFNGSGGSLRLVSDSATIDLSYISVDFDNDVITLQTTLGASWPAGTKVLTLPLGTQLKAMVDLNDGDEGIVAIVPAGPNSQLDTGIRDEVDQEAVMVSDDSGRWEISNIDDERKKVLGSQVDPTGFTPADVATTTSPTPNVLGGIRVLNLTWAPTDGTNTKIQVHMSTTSGFTPVFNDTTTKVGDFEGTGAVIDKTPAGTELQVTYDDDGNPATSEVPRVYYFKTIAWNPLGQAPTSAQASGSLRKITGPDVSADAVWAGFMYADRLLAADVKVTLNLTAGGEISTTGADGSKVSLSGKDGFQVLGPTSLGNPQYVSFPTDGRPNIIGGTLNATVLTVEGDATSGTAATFRRNSRFEPGATLTLNDTISEPAAAPILSAVSDKRATTGGPTQSTDDHTICGGVIYSGELYWTEWKPTPDATQYTNIVYKVNLTTNAISAVTTITSANKLVGITRVPGTNGWRLLWQALNRQLVIQSHDDTTWAMLVQINIGNLGNSYDAWSESMAIGTDGTDVWVAALDDPAATTTTSKFRFRRYLANLSTNAVQETVLTTYGISVDVGLPKAHIRSFHVGNMDFGARKFVVSQGLVGVAGSIYTFSTTGAIEPTNTWQLQLDFYGPSIMAWDGTRFWDASWSPANKTWYVYRYTTMKLSDVKVLHYAYSTNYDPVALQETKSSPGTSTQLYSRWRWQVTVGTPPTSLVARVYLGTVAGSGNSHLQATLASGVVATIQESYNAAGAAPPSVSGFTSVTPAVIQSQAVFNKTLASIGTTSGSATITGTARFRPWMVGQPVTGTGIPAGATISSVAVDRNSATLSAAATATGTITLTFPNQPKVMLRGDGYGRLLELESLIISGTDDASALAGNAPPLRVGDVAGTHMRIDGNELIAMDSDSVQGTMLLNAGGPINASGWVKNGVKNSGTMVANTDKTVSVAFTSAFPASGPIPEVLLTVKGLANLGNPPDVSAINVTRSGFDLLMRRSSTAAFDVSYLALATTIS